MKTGIIWKVDLLVFLDVTDAILFVSQPFHWVYPEMEREPFMLV